MSSAPFVIAIAQPRMFWSTAENTDESIAIAARAAGEGAQVCVFPELSLTGYHRRIREEAVPANVDAALDRLKQCAQQRHLALAIGLPTFAADGRIRNSYRFIGPDGEALATIDKRGLTAAEATFFVPGTARPVATIAGVRCSAVMCREVEDESDVCADVEALGTLGPSVIFWPGLMGPEPGTEHLDPPRHVQQAQVIARRLRATVVQSNWPMSLNYPALSATAGKSVVIGPDGAIQITLPQAETGFAIVRLGSPAYAWHARV